MEKIVQPGALAEVEQLEREILSSIAQASTPEELEGVRIRYLARKGSLSQLLDRIGQFPKEIRPEIGRKANALKERAWAAFEDRKKELKARAQATLLDPTLPGRPVVSGSLHPILELRARIVQIFRTLGFALADGPEVETEYYNFDALNTPPDHPARTEQDTFYLADQELALEWDQGQPKKGRLLLRPQTSPVQVRVMQSHKPPIRVIAPGRCYRRDEIDATHHIAFFQVEGLVVDEGISVCELKGTLEVFFRELLGKDLEFRFRPHYFPFTEPSFEVDARRPGRMFHGKEWLELCGCGMVHPKVLQGVGLDPERYQGFAFGFGIDRFAMILCEVPDLRFFTENDVRLLQRLSPVV
ncbi:phenylalanine--tRNA ligase subunit alpha [Candidatus Methylacidithermus pantelleriae]|uniref:Phenylalanine--tRNA ligase alpha subunit n=1 Tax=Candidatus Methylacidithermus pantelleriae TaxID=2744239 RepID=A0A8J2FT84_9BACT|nr:phenylalanine--tRNA ligase subunit alpha [Candidatus Methylacidithermus pantelleriae]CAF0700889.1 Phenylalanine--tRNA ligase alpha subunit [Candidatus Methylacidithermus pantelleriae]